MAWLRTVDNRRLGGKQKPAGNSHHWNGEWTDRASKAGPGEGYSVRHRQEVSTVSATNSGVVGSAKGNEGINHAHSKLHSSHFYLKKHTYKCLLKTPFILSVNR